MTESDGRYQCTLPASTTAFFVEAVDTAGRKSFAGPRPINDNYFYGLMEK